MIMRKYLLPVALTAALGGVAMAQTSPGSGSPTAPSTSPTAPPTTAPGTPSRNDAAAPLPGANSFTEAQARERIEGAGFSQITELRKDDQGIWRGNALRAGTRTPVALDYRGNVVAQ
jgi:hypothetical protein